MKSLLRNTQLFVLSGFVGWLSTGCDKNAANEATPQLDCRIQKQLTTVQSKLSVSSLQTTYEYDAQGNLVKTEAISESKSVGSSVSRLTGTTTEGYTYTNEGYLTASTKQTRTISLFNGQTTEEQISSVNSYSYANGRLAGYTTQFTNPRGTTTSTYAYTYDNSGSLTQMTQYNPANPTAYMFIWTYQKNQLVDYVEKSGTTERHPFTIQDGLITKMVFPGSINELVVRTIFDSRRRLIKREEYVDGQLTQYESQTWTDAKPASTSLPLFKGFPVETYSVYTGQTGVLATRAQFYWNSISKTMQQHTESTHAVQTNAQGFVTNATIMVKHPNPDIAYQDYTTTETYTYTGCQ